MRCEPHPVSGALYEEIGNGLVKVNDKARNKSGIFKWNGEWVEGDLTQADFHFLNYIGGPVLPPEKDIFWTVLPVAGLGEKLRMSGSPGRGGADQKEENKAQRPKIIAPYVGDPGMETPEGTRSSAYLPMEYFIENDRKAALIPEVYKKSSPFPGGPKKVRRATAASPLAPAPTADRQTLLPIQPVELLVVHDVPLAFEHDADTAIAEPPTQAGDLAHLLADHSMVGRTFSPDRLGVDADQHAGTALRDLVVPHHAERCVPSLAWRRQTFPNRSFRIALSSTLSASNRLSLPFSSSSWRSRRASDTSRPPYFAFSL